MQGIALTFNLALLPMVRSLILFYLFTQYVDVLHSIRFLKVNCIRVSVQSPHF